MRFVLVGGHRDGERVDLLPHQQWVQFAVPREPMGRKSTMELETYVAVRFSGGTEPRVVMALSGMSADEVLAKLIEGYRL